MKYISTVKKGFDLGIETECQWNTAKKEYSSKSLKPNFFVLAWVNVSANYAQIPHAHSSNPPAPLSQQRTKKTKETDKQTVTEKKNIKERKLSFHIAAELRRQWRLISWFFAAPSVWAASTLQASDQCCGEELPTELLPPLNHRSVLGEEVSFCCRRLSTISFSH